MSDVNEKTGEKEEKRLVCMKDVGMQLIDWQSDSTKKSYVFWAKKYEAWKAEECPRRCHSEETLVMFALSCCKKYAPSTIWCAMSHIKKYVRIEKEVDLGELRILNDFLKRNSERHVPKKSEIFSLEEVKRFLREAPNEGQMLMCKLAMVMGFYGCLRMGEIHAVRLTDLSMRNEGFEILVRKSKTDQAGRGRRCLVPATPNDVSVCAREVLVKYLEQIGKKLGEDTPLWWQTRDGKMHAQTIGKNALASTPRKIAEFLHLDNASRFTGHAFRGSSATAMVEGGLDITTMKRHGGWKSTPIAEDYIRPTKKIRTTAVSPISGESVDITAKGGKAQAMFSNCLFRDCIVNLSADGKACGGVAKLDSETATEK